ncbi:hypothetical protein BC829DRAFT_258760 [Chytridium lagenaria]|nr:hypothetical protein BC829DRAFT_258760 [Chytridium lagenaria]
MKILCCMRRRISFGQRSKPHISANIKKISENTVCHHHYYVFLNMLNKKGLRFGLLKLCVKTKKVGPKMEAVLTFAQSTFRNLPPQAQRAVSDFAPYADVTIWTIVMTLLLGISNPTSKQTSLTIIFSPASPSSLSPFPLLLCNSNGTHPDC